MMIWTAGSHVRARSLVELRIAKLMKFVEINGATLLKLVGNEEIPGLRAAGVSDKSQIRINPQGDIELFNHGSWSIIGGLLGDYENRIRKLTGRDWS
jgi:hypothetical protein